MGLWESLAGLSHEPVRPEAPIGGARVGQGQGEKRWQGKARRTGSTGARLASPALCATVSGPKTPAGTGVPNGRPGKSGRPCAGNGSRRKPDAWLRRAALWTEIEDELFIAQKLVFRNGTTSWGLTGLNPGERWDLEAAFLEGRLGDVLKEAHGVIGDGAYLLEAEGVQVIR